jgi:hypothetical protein
MLVPGEGFHVGAPEVAEVCHDVRLHRQHLNSAANVELRDCYRAWHTTFGRGERGAALSCYREQHHMHIDPVDSHPADGRRRDQAVGAVLSQFLSAKGVPISRDR